MERGISVRLGVSKILPLVALTFLAHSTLADVVVLVTDKDSPIRKISSLDIRKAYLGISVSIDGMPIRALGRRDDQRLNQIFLQSVMAMSERSYERRQLSLMLKFATPRPQQADDSEELLELLARYPSSIAYMWISDAENDSRVRIISVLWKEQ